jgi:hypothetical protein
MKKRFYPFAEKQGFARAKSTDSLFTLFRRHAAGTTHVFEIQWDKYHRPYFVLNFGEAPAAGVTAFGTHVAATDIELVHCAANGRLQRRRGGPLSCWFHLRKPLLKAVQTGAFYYRPDEVVDQVIAAFAELEEWWRTKQEGPHIYILR